MEKEQQTVSLGPFLKRNWLGIIGIVGTIVGVTLSVYFYKMSVVFPEPVFLLDPVRTTIVDSQRFSEAPLRVVRANGDEIKGDVTSVRFYFWNNGKKSIKPLTILEPLVITLDDPNGEILDYKILKCSRKVVEPSVERNPGDPNKNLLLSFAILEQKDGLTGQVIYSGKPEAKLAIYGAIEDVRKILTNAIIIQRGWPKEFIKEISFAILVLGTIVLLGVNMALSTRNRPTKPKPTKPKPTKWSEVSPISRIAFILFVISVLSLYNFDGIRTAQKAR
jgi:hypothetical protein